MKKMEKIHSINKGVTISQKRSQKRIISGSFIQFHGPTCAQFPNWQTVNNKLKVLAKKTSHNSCTLIVSICTTWGLTLNAFLIN